jgi:hypothetical protein
MLTFKYLQQQLRNKEYFEKRVKHLYNCLKREFDIKWSPKQFIITTKVNYNAKEQGWGGDTQRKFAKNGDASYFLNLQLFSSTLDIDVFIGTTVTHEMLHFFLPYVEGNSCWSEGVTDFVTFWFHDTIDENLKKLKREFKNIADLEYRAHKYGYITGFAKMVKLYKKSPTTVIRDIKRLVRDHHTTLQKHYTVDDIVAYNPAFKTFFLHLCNEHVVHKL